MAIEFIGAGRSTSSTVTVPTHVAGDLIVITAMRDSSNVVVPSGWTTAWQAGRVGSDPAGAVAYRVATGSGTTSGTWTGADALTVAVYRGAGDAPAAVGVRGFSVSVNALFDVPSLTLTESSSWVAIIAAADPSLNDTSISGMTHRGNGVFDTDGAHGSTSWPEKSIAPGYNVYFAAAAIELTLGSQDEAFSGSSASSHSWDGVLEAVEHVAIAGSRGVAASGAGVFDANDGELRSMAGTETRTPAQTGTWTQTDALGFSGSRAVSSTGTGVFGVPVEAALFSGSIVRASYGAGRFKDPTKQNTATPPLRDLDAVLAGSGPRRCWVEVLSGPAQGETLPVTAGSITEDLASDVRRVGSLTVAGLPEWVPEDATDALDVRSGIELQIWLGIEDDEGVEHKWSQGIFRPSRPSVSRDGGGLSIDVDVTDRSHAVGLSRIRRRWAALAGTGIIESCITVLAEVAPWLPIDISLDGDIEHGTDGVIAEYGDDVWKAARVLLEGLGLDLHIDEHGVAVAPVKIDPLTAAPHVLPGLTAVSVSTDVEDVVNVIGCPWEEARPESAGENWVPEGGIEEAVDETSSTSIHTPLGTRARLYEGDTSVIHAPPHARLAAQSQLINEMDLQRAASGSMIPDPRVKVGVPVEVEGHVHRVTRLTIDLAGAETGVDFGASVPQIHRLLASRPVAPERETTEIVTAVNPLRSRPVTEPGGPETVVEWTDAVKGVEVGDPIRVRHKGVGHRVAVAILVHKTVEDKHAGEAVGTVGGADVTVGGDTQLRARVGTSGSYQTFSDGDVTLPEPDAASTSHTHLLNYTSSGIPQPPSLMIDAVSNSVDALNNTRHRINDVISTMNSWRSTLLSSVETGQPRD